MALAAFFGGLAFTKAYVGYVHAFSHKIGGHLWRAARPGERDHAALRARLHQGRPVRRSAARGARTSRSAPARPDESRARPCAALRGSCPRAQPRGRNPGEDRRAPERDIPAIARAAMIEANRDYPGAEGDEARRGPGAAATDVPRRLDARLHQVIAVLLTQRHLLIFPVAVRECSRRARRRREAATSRNAARCARARNRAPACGPAAARRSAAAAPPTSGGARRSRPPSARPDAPQAQFSMSTELIHSPPDLMTSLARSVICR